LSRGSEKKNTRNWWRGRIDRYSRGRQQNLNANFGWGVGNRHAYKKKNQVQKSGAKKMSFETHTSKDFGSAKMKKVRVKETDGF